MTQKKIKQFYYDKTAAIIRPLAPFADRFVIICNVEKKTIDTITKFVMVLLVLMGLVLVLMETVMDPVGLYW